jgi:non-ribosomal peptide synthetase component F
MSSFLFYFLRVHARLNQRLVSFLTKQSNPHTTYKTNALVSNASLLRTERFVSMVHISNEFTIQSYTNKMISYATTINMGFNLTPDSIHTLIDDRARQVPNRICYAFPHNRGLKLRYIELKQRVTTLAQSLLNLGFSKGNQIAVCLPHTYELAVFILTCAYAGLIAVSMNSAYQLVEIEDMLKQTGSEGFLFYDSFKTLDHLNLIRKLCPELDACQPG